VKLCSNEDQGSTSAPDKASDTIPHHLSKIAGAAERLRICKWHKARATLKSVVQMARDAPWVGATHASNGGTRAAAYLNTRVQFYKQPGILQANHRILQAKQEFYKQNTNSTSKTGILQANNTFLNKNTLFHPVRL
jgi:hypothetical protein